MAEFILKDWYGKDCRFNHDTIFVQDVNGELVEFTQGKGESVLESLEVTENGTYIPSEGVDGFDSVTVDVPIPEVVLQDKTITENGTFTADAGFDGLGSVTVDVKGSGVPDMPDNVIAYEYNANAEVVGATLYGYTEIPEYAFDGIVETLEYVDLSNCPNMKSIPTGKFNGWSKITSVLLPESITNIGENAFRDCTNLTSITIPESVTSIGTRAFYGCTGLETINFNATSMNDLTSSSYVFSKCGENSDGVEVNIGENVEIIPNDIFNCSNNITSVIFKGTSVTSIGTRAFNECTNLTSITIPESVTSIGINSFNNCTNMTGIWVNENNQYYYSDEYGVLFIKATNSVYVCPRAFSGVYTIQEGVMATENNSFRACTGLTGIVFPKNDISIGSYSFQSCGFTELSIPSNVTLGIDAFRENKSLVSVTFEEGITEISMRCLLNCTALESIVIPSSVKHIGSYAFSGSTLTNATFRDTSGWYVSTSATATSGTNISSVDLENKSTAATYLKDTYKSYYWFDKT